MVNLTDSSRRWYYLAFSTHLGLLLWVIIWQFRLSPHPHFNAIIMTLLWANFILMLYFLHALTLLTLAGEQIFAAVELGLCLGAFVANIVFARIRGRELKTHLPRLSQVEKEEQERFSSHSKY
ncbi:DUF2069 domain-containing protein [Photobacterium damselae subsp. damselae]|uniref:DUF2069 domain-containing protein n=1 Tax=Photobacterium damselae TaxID=38293 RepID=UPI000A2FF71E|nr:DUF2069 domain-containing protein [Photobacterium damselae]ARR49974.1 hypothetical protein CAY62_10775 [Photobacterium damselae subsp. damselae]QAY35480.1 DUF2069 domain-containing protein [Photobacterium damselae subsp. damselae]